MLNSFDVSEMAKQIGLSIKNNLIVSDRFQQRSSFCHDWNLQRQRNADRPYRKPQILPVRRFSRKEPCRIRTRRFQEQGCQALHQTGLGGGLCKISEWRRLRTLRGSQGTGCQRTGISSYRQPQRRSPERPPRQIVSLQRNRGL